MHFVCITIQGPTIVGKWRICLSGFGPRPNNHKFGQKCCYFRQVCLQSERKSSPLWAECGRNTSACFVSKGLRLGWCTPPLPPRVQSPPKCNSITITWCSDKVVLGHLGGGGGGGTQRVTQPGPGTPRHTGVGMVCILMPSPSPPPPAMNGRGGEVSAWGRGTMIGTDRQVGDCGACRLGNQKGCPDLPLIPRPPSLA